MLNKPLSLNEKMVLYGLVRYPLYTDRELAKALKIKLPTITSIRHRLRDEGYYTTIRVPRIQDLGAEVISVSYNSFDSSSSLEVQRKTIQQLADGQDETFFFASDFKQGLFLQIGGCYTDVKRNINDVEEVYTKQRLFGSGGVNTFLFPYSLSQLDNFFDFAPLLYQYFDLGSVLKGAAPSVHPDWPGQPGKPPNLTKTEKRVLCALVRYPDMADKYLADEIDVSRRTVGRVRKAFEDNGLIRQLRVVNLNKLDFGILALEYVRFNLELPHSKPMVEAIPFGRKILESLLRIKPPILSLSGPIEAVTLTPYKDFSDLRDSTRKFADIYKRYEVYAREPVQVLFSLPDMEVFKDQVFGPITESIMGVDLG